MPDKPAPEVRMIVDLGTIRQNYVAKAWEDGHIDPEERAAIRVIDNLTMFTEDVQARRAVAAAIIKGVETESYLNKLAAPMGVKIVSIDAERESRKIVEFPQRRPEHA